MDPYQILGLKPGESDLRTIKRAYNRLLRIHRPEGDPIGFRKIRDAYEAIVNPIMRERDFLKPFTPVTLNSTDLRDENLPFSDDTQKCDNKINENLSCNVEEENQDDSDEVNCEYQDYESDEYEVDDSYEYEVDEDGDEMPPIIDEDYESDEYELDEYDIDEDGDEMSPEMEEIWFDYLQMENKKSAEVDNLPEEIRECIIDLKSFDKEITDVQEAELLEIVERFTHLIQNTYPHLVHVWSNYLLDIFEDRLELLQEKIQDSQLFWELEQGNQTLSKALINHWWQGGNCNNLILFGSLWIKRIDYCRHPEVVDFSLSLANKLTFIKPKLAEKLLDISFSLDNSAHSQSFWPDYIEYHLIMGREINKWMLHNRYRVARLVVDRMEDGQGEEFLDVSTIRKISSLGGDSKLKQYLTEHYSETHLPFLKKNIVQNLPYEKVSNLISWIAGIIILFGVIVGLSDDKSFNNSNSSNNNFSTNDYNKPKIDIPKIDFPPPTIDYKNPMNDKAVFEKIWKDMEKNQELMEENRKLTEIIRKSLQQKIKEKSDKTKPSSEKKKTDNEKSVSKKNREIKEKNKRKTNDE